MRLTQEDAPRELQRGWGKRQPYQMVDGGNEPLGQAHESVGVCGARQAFSEKQHAGLVEVGR